MGLFDNGSAEKGEVRIGVSEKEESRLKTDVEEKMGEMSKGSASKDISLEDIHRQNEKIIDLLEKMVNSSSSGSSSSKRVTDRKEDDGGGGMGELL